MNVLDKYTEELKQQIKDKNLTEELEIIKYVYIDLGKKLSFDPNFIPFGNSKAKQNIYKYHCTNITDLEECLNTKTAICKSLSIILEYILKQFDINIKTVTDPKDDRSCPHVFNFVVLKDQRKFCIDLQEDLNNIQTHSFTNNFGLESIYNTNLEITRKEQEIIDKKIGYITEDNYYSDDYLYLMHSIADGIEDFSDKVDFILENIDISNTIEMGYTDRQWHHKKILEEFFTSKEFDYFTDTGKIKMIDCYKKTDDNNKKYINCIVVMNGNESTIYVYNVNESQYRKISLENFATAITHGLVIHNGSGIPGLNKEIHAIKQENMKR